MHKELTVTIGETPLNVFLQNGFYPHTPPTPTPHKHFYSEVHLFAGGAAQFQVEKETFSLPENSVILVPPGRFHCCIYKEESAKHTAFQISFPAEHIEIFHTEYAFALAFLNQIEQSKQTGDYASVAAYIAFFCSFLCKIKPVQAKQIKDPTFLISEFFSDWYHTDVQVEDLAEELSMSVRQTERMVIQVTGKCFRDMLVHTRMTAAKQLLETTDMPLSQIAQTVGYQSYAGFWKAAKKYDLL